MPREDIDLDRMIEEQMEREYPSDEQEQNWNEANDYLNEGDLEDDIDGEFDYQDEVDESNFDPYAGHDVMEDMRDFDFDE